MFTAMTMPEGYAIEKDGNMFYAFYAGRQGPAREGKTGTGRKSREWKGPVELRGLQSRQYKVVDYVNNKDYGTVTGPDAKLDAEFNGSLLLQATPHRKWAGGEIIQRTCEKQFGNALRELCLVFVRYSALMRLPVEISRNCSR